MSAPSTPTKGVSPVPIRRIMSGAASQQLNRIADAAYGKPARFFMITAQIRTDLKIEEEAKSQFDALAKHEAIKFCAGQVEKAPSTGQLHWQLYVGTKKPSRPSLFRNISVFETAPHVEYRKASHDQALSYVTKEDTRVYGPYMFGTQPGQGKRTDLDEIAEQVLDKSIPMRELLVSKPKYSLLYADKMCKLRASVLPERDMEEPPIVYVFWGDSGTGKTKAVYDYAAAHSLSIYKKMPGKWWDHYWQQDIVLIDDFNTKFFGHTQKEDVAFMLQLLDRYPMNVEFKGGSVPFNSKFIFITSNYDPTDWFPEVFEACGEQRKAFRRRFTEVRKYTRAGQTFFGDATVSGI